MNIQQWIKEVENEANTQQLKREHQQAAYRRALRQTLWSIPALALISYLGFGFQEPAPWTEQEILGEQTIQQSGWLKRTNQP